MKPGERSPFFYDQFCSTSMVVLEEGFHTITLWYHCKVTPNETSACGETTLLLWIILLNFYDGLKRGVHHIPTASVLCWMTYSLPLVCLGLSSAEILLTIQEKRRPYSALDMASRASTASCTLLALTITSPLATIPVLVKHSSRSLTSRPSNCATATGQQKTKLAVKGWTLECQSEWMAEIWASKPISKKTSVWVSEWSLFLILLARHHTKSPVYKMNVAVFSSSSLLP